MKNRIRRKKSLERLLYLLGLSNDRRMLSVKACVTSMLKSDPDSWIYEKELLMPVSPTSRCMIYSCSTTFYIVRLIIVFQSESSQWR